MSIRDSAMLIRKTLLDFEIQMSGDILITKSPTLTKYSFDLASGTKYSKVKSIEKEIGLALNRSVEVLVEDGDIVIVVPNWEREYVEVSESEAYPRKGMDVFIGINTNGEREYLDIENAPHVLIGGATGTGKSICLHNIITTLTKNPDVYLVLIDPKRVELSRYEGKRNVSVYTSNDESIAKLMSLVSEMEGRYKEMEEQGVVKCTDKKIVVVIDELADLIITGGKGVEKMLIRLTQLGRAAGIHVIVATQRPSADIITGSIKANMPTRIAFRVSSGIDSRVILDESGAEKLLGKGDMLLKQVDTKRIQGVKIKEYDRAGNRI